uniref:Dot/Icm T4SS effector n=1 Tax=Panagrellus redivivus TaxID=6233 RepID=A0A7E4WAJ4_PANRE
MDNLIPHYSKEARSCLIDEIYDPVPDYKVIAADDLRDAVKLAQFFNVTHEYLLQSFMFPDNCEISNCMKFMEESRSLGYTTIVNCVVFCGKTADKDLICGLQVFIALKPDQEDVFFPILEKHKTDVEPRYQLPAEGTLRTFPNFKGVLETPYSQFFKYLFHAQQYTSQLHLFLGKNKKTEIPTHLTLESSKVECLLIGRQLLAFLNERLNTAFKTTELEKQIDDIEFVIVGKSFGEVKTSSSACKGSVVVNGVAEKLPPFLTSLTETTNPYIVVHHQGGDLNDDQKYRTSWDKTANNVGRLLEHIKSIDPVTQNEFKSVKLLNELGVRLRHKLRTQKVNDQIQQLMATVANTCLSGSALFCRQKCDTAEPISTEDMLDKAIRFWQVDTIVSTLTDLKPVFFK